MEQDYIETAFDNFLDTQKYDQAEEALFAITRAAFLAGWNAAKTSFSSEHQRYDHRHAGGQTSLKALSSKGYINPDTLFTDPKEHAPSPFLANMLQNSPELHTASTYFVQFHEDSLFSQISPCLLWRNGISWH